MKNMLAFLFAALLLSGCVSYQYSGKNAPEKTEKVAVFTDSAKISKPYAVLGKATVSGNYLQISRDKLMDKLLAEGKKSGADAILIVEQQVVPYEKHSAEQNDGYMTAFDYNDNNTNWSQLYQQVDQNFGSIRPKEEKKVTRDLSSYKRVIRAEFLKYNAGTPASVKAPAAQPKASALPAQVTQTPVPEEAAAPTQTKKQAKAPFVPEPVQKQAADVSSAPGENKIAIPATATTPAVEKK